jgi:hypothetical protein
MFGIGLFIRKKPQDDAVVDLDDFLHDVSPTVDEEVAPATAPVSEDAPGGPAPPDVDARLDEALSETFPASDPIAVSQAELAPAGC